MFLKVQHRLYNLDMFEEIYVEPQDDTWYNLCGRYELGRYDTDRVECLFTDVDDDFFEKFKRIVAGLKAGEYLVDIDD